MNGLKCITQNFHTLNTQNHLHGECQKNKTNFASMVRSSLQTAKRMQRQVELACRVDYGGAAATGGLWRVEQLPDRGEETRPVV